MKVLVTGGGGFIGAYVLKGLVEAGHQPVVFDLRDDRRKIAEIFGEPFAAALPWITGDIADTDTVVAACEGCEGIIHLAGIMTPACQANPVLGANVNLIGTLNVFLAARAHGIGYLSYMSSAGVFGPVASEEPRPTTLYGAFKLGAEHAARAFHADDGTSSIGFRPFVVYGAGREIGGSAGPTLACRAAAEGRPYTMPFTGGFDLIHAGDVAACFVEALRLQPEGAQVVNMAGLPTDPDAMFAEIRRSVPDAQLSAEGPPLPVVCPDYDTTLDSLFPDWTQRPLAEGLAQTIDFYRR